MAKEMNATKNLSVFSDVIMSLASDAASEVEGVEVLRSRARSKKSIRGGGVSVYFLPNEKVTVDVFVNVNFPCRVPEAVAAVQEKSKGDRGSDALQSAQCQCAGRQRHLPRAVGTMRRASREYVFKLVFEFGFYGERHNDTLELMLADSDLTDEDRAYIRSTYAGVTSQADSLKARIAESWSATPWTGSTVPTSPSS